MKTGQIVHTTTLKGQTLLLETQSFFISLEMQIWIEWFNQNQKVCLGVHGKRLPMSHNVLYSVPRMFLLNWLL